MTAEEDGPIHGAEALEIGGFLVLSAVVLSNTVGLLIDTFVFLWLAFHSLTFWQGQVIGKAWMTLLAIAVLVPVRRAVPRYRLDTAGA